MDFAAITDWTLLRSVLLALVAWPACQWLERGLRASRQPQVFLALLAAPFLFPELLIGYVLAPWTVGRPWRAELVCTAVLLLRSVPVGVIALWGSPASAVSPAALHVRRMKLNTLRDGWELVRCYLHGPVARMLPAVGLMFLITFQEFEAVALLGAVSWTDQLFTEHGKGLLLAESARFLLRPFGIQAAALALIGWSLWNRHRSVLPEGVESEDSPISPVSRRLAEITAALFCVVGAVVPILLLSRELSEGWAWLIRQPRAGKNLAAEICTAGLVGLVAGLAAWNAARLVSSRQLPRWLPALASLPGLCGGLTVSLVVLWLSTRIGVRAFSWTPVAWVFALIVWLLPRAILLQFWLSRQNEPASLHLVKLLRDSPVNCQRRMAQKWRWRWQIEPQLAAVGLLCYWAYLDLPSAELLAPPGMASVLVRLYNFMHFGHSAAMSMEAAIVMFLPLLLWGLMMAAARTLAGKA